MKITLLIVILTSALQLNAQIVNIPDPVFKQALLDHGFNTGIEIDTNFDGEIQVSEAEALTGILDVNGQFIDIHDLTGIEAFVNITELSVWLNQLTSLDLSNNTSLIKLLCTDNNIDYLNVTNCLELEILNCEINQLSNLDLTNNINLKQLVLRNNSLESLDLINNTNLQSVSISDNSLEFLDIRSGQNTNITGFTSEDNPNLTCIFVDDIEYSEANWYKDDASTFVETETECKALNISDFSIYEINLFPNPINKEFTIKANFEISKINIFNLSGKLITRYSFKEKYDISYLPQGFYFLQIHTKVNSTVIIKKLIKR